MNTEQLDKEQLAKLLYEIDQKIHYGHVKTPWEGRVHGAATQGARKRAELILLEFVVLRRKP